MWILRGNNTSKTNDFVSFKTFWGNAVQIPAFTPFPASQHRYGMAATNDDASAHLHTDAVSTFGMAYATTQESLQSNIANIAAIQGQLQMLCQAAGIGQPPGKQPQCPRNGCGRGQQCGGNNGGSNGSGYSGSGGYNNGGGGYSGGGSGDNANSGGRSGGGGGKGGNYTRRSGSGNGSNQSPSGLPPLPVKWYENWNYCFTHGGNVNNSHTSATCAYPSENH
jgi:hypothetical protein